MSRLPRVHLRPGILPPEDSNLRRGSSGRGSVHRDLRGASAQQVNVQPDPLSTELVKANTNRQDDDNTDVNAGWKLEFPVPLVKGDVPNEIVQDGRYFIPKEKRDKPGYTLAEGTPAREHIAKLLREAGAIPTIHAEPHDPVKVSIAAALPARPWKPSTSTTDTPCGRPYRNPAAWSRAAG